MARDSFAASKGACQTLRREVRRNIQNQLRRIGAEDADRTIHSRHDGHVRSDGAIVCVEGRDYRLRLTVRPKRDVRESARRDHSRIQNEGLRGCSRETSGGTDGQAKAAVEDARTAARIYDPARRNRVQRQAATGRWREIPVDVDGKIRIIARVNVDRASRAGGNDGRIRGNRAARIQRGHDGL